MYFFNDFSCPNKLCKEYDIIKEHMHEADETPQCGECSTNLRKAMPAPVGYVKGTRTPCNPFK